MFINTRKFLNTPSGLIPNPSHTRTHPAPPARVSLAAPGRRRRSERLRGLPLPRCGRPGDARRTSVRVPAGGGEAPPRAGSTHPPTPGSLLPLLIFTAVLSSFSTRPSLPLFRKPRKHAGSDIPTRTGTPLILRYTLKGTQARRSAGCSHSCKREATFLFVGYIYLCTWTFQFVHYSGV